MSNFKMEIDKLVNLKHWEDDPILDVIVRPGEVQSYSDATQIFSEGVSYIKDYGLSEEKYKIYLIASGKIMDILVESEGIDMPEDKKSFETRAYAISKKSAEAKYEYSPEEKLYFDCRKNFKEEVESYAVDFPENSPAKVFNAKELQSLVGHYNHNFAYDNDITIEDFIKKFPQYYSFKEMADYWLTGEKTTRVDLSKTTLPQKSSLKKLREKMEIIPIMERGLSLLSSQAAIRPDEVKIEYPNQIEKNDGGWIGIKIKKADVNMFFDFLAYKLGSAIFDAVTDDDDYDRQAILKDLRKDFEKNGLEFVFDPSEIIKKFNLRRQKYSLENICNIALSAGSISISVILDECLSLRHHSEGAGVPSKPMVAGGRVLARRDSGSLLIGDVIRIICHGNGDASGLMPVAVRYLYLIHGEICIIMRR